MVKIRLLRAGAKRRPYYRVIAVDERRRRDTRALDFLGTYDPVREPAEIRLATERIEDWRARGAQLTPAVRGLMRRARRQPAPAPDEAAQGAKGAAAPQAAEAAAGGASGEGAGAAATEGST